MSLLKGNSGFFNFFKISDNMLESSFLIYNNLSGKICVIKKDIQTVSNTCHTHDCKILIVIKIFINMHYNRTDMEIVISNHCCVN